MQKRWTRGLALSLCSILLWGLQPVALSYLVKTVPASAIAFYKTSSATIIFALVMMFTGTFSTLEQSKKSWLIFVFGGFALAFSYATYNQAYLYISPSNAQVYFQLSRILFAFFGIFIFKEKFSNTQWAGLAVLITGLILFFQNQITFDGSHNYYWGLSLILLSSVTWALYAVFQKILVLRHSPLLVLVIVYFISSLMLVQYADYKPLLNLNLPNWSALSYVCLSNMIAYWCFTEALKIWDASRIGAISCLTPLVTILFSSFFSSQISVTETFTWFTVLGAIATVFGSIIASVRFERR